VYARVFAYAREGRPTPGRNDRAAPGFSDLMVKPKLKLTEYRERARRTARGSVPPAGIDPDAPPVAGTDGRERRAIRQRLRRTRSMRRARLAELGTLTAEMHARGRWNQDLVDKWVRELDGSDAELRGLEQALRAELSLDDLIAARVVAQCGDCGRIAGTGDAYCAGCGRELALSARSAPSRSETAPTQTLVGELTTIQPSP
jgi:hypothetical protein